MAAAEEAKKEEAPAEKEEAKEVEAPKEPEKPKELEEDAATDSRKKLPTNAVKFNEADSTLNCMPVAGGSLLMTLGEGGMQYLLAGTRALAGMKSGRYMFEVRVAELLNPSEPNGSQGKAPAPKQLTRVGVSLAGSSLFLSDTADSVCFDSEGFFWHGKSRKKIGARFGRCTMAVVLNLDASSPNKNTISLFKDGVRACEPQALPEGLCGKALFPAVTYRNVTLETNFGPAPRTSLPFKCRMLGDAAAADVELVTPKVGDKCEVVLPVGLPEGGLFDWIDTFMAKNPDFIELSDRTIVQWAKKSGIGIPREAGSNDKPSLAFNVPLMDDSSVRKVISSIAPALKRNYLIGELRANLVPDERNAILGKFSHFKKTAIVVIGSPDNDYTAAVQSLLLKEKVAKAELEKKKQAQEAARKKALDEKKRLAEEAKKARLKKDGSEQPAEEEKKEEAEPAPMEDVGPVELTEEEKKVVHRKHRLPDISEKALAKSFTSFALPTKADGFDEVKFLWDDAKKCEELLTAYKHENKITQKIEDLKPSEWFKEQLAAWQKTLQAWKKLSNEWKSPALKQKLLAKKKAEAEAKAKEEGTEVAEPMKVDMEDLDVMAVEDVGDVGTGEPLFSKFEHEDWALLSLRYELFLLLHAFRKDLDDPERTTFQKSHLVFYFSKYFGRNLNFANFTCKSIEDLVKLVKDTIEIDASDMLKGLLPEETVAGHFVKLCESHRRDRERRADAGDETAKLQFPKSAPTQPASRPPTAAPGAGPKRPWQAAGAPAPAGPAWKQARTGPYTPAARGTYAPGPFRR